MRLARFRKHPGGSEIAVLPSLIFMVERVPNVIGVTRLMTPQGVFQDVEGGYAANVEEINAALAAPIDVIVVE